MSKGTIDLIIKHQEQIAKERIQKEERRIIEDFTAEGKLTAQGMNSTIIALLAEKALPIAQTPKRLIIANAATAAAIRKRFGREEVEIIITPAVEELTAYAVTDKDLKQQLLESIKRRGY